MTAPTVLVIAQAQDTTADRVVDALRRRPVTVARIDTADFPGSMQVHGRPDRPRSQDWLVTGETRVDLTTVRSVYRWHPAQFTFPASMSEPERRFATLESVSGLGGVLAAQSWRWLDSPAAVADASYKPRQISVAAECGMRVPRSLVTNVGAEVRDFADEVGGPIVYKSLSTGLVVERDGLKIVYTSRVNIDDLDDGAVALCCHLFQEWVPKSHDVRLTVVGDRCFAVAVHADSDQARVDWRSRYGDLRYKVCVVPEEVRSAALSYLRRFGLRYTAFDFSVTPDGEWWFLEGNSAGQWEWLAEETDMPIAEAIADELVGAV